MLLPPPELAERVVVFIDMVSYSRHIGVDEASTLEFMAGCFDSFRILARKFNGTLVKTLGDGALVLFDDAADAVRYGLEFQNIVSDNQSGARDPYMFRVGLHMGAVHLKNGDVFGNTVNIAARLREKARPGECVLSREVFDGVREETGYAFEHLGEHCLKNISEQVAMFRVAEHSDKRRVAAHGGMHRIEILGAADTIPTLSGRPLGADARAGLGYLAMCSGRAESIDRMEALIGSPSRLSEALTDLSGAEVPPVLRIDRMVALDIRTTETDLEGFVAELRRGHVPAVLSRDPEWPEHILNGLDDVSPVFRSWVRIARSIWCHRIND